MHRRLSNENFSQSSFRYRFNDLRENHTHSIKFCWILIQVLNNNQRVSHCAPRQIPWLIDSKLYSKNVNPQMYLSRTHV